MTTWNTKLQFYSAEKRDKKYSRQLIDISVQVTDTRVMMGLEDVIRPKMHRVETDHNRGLLSRIMWWIKSSVMNLAQSQKICDAVSPISQLPPVDTQIGFRDSFRSLFHHLSYIDRTTTPQRTPHCSRRQHRTKPVTLSCTHSRCSYCCCWCSCCCYCSD